MESPYRRGPAERAAVSLSEVTSPLGWGRVAAAVLLALGVASGVAPQVTELGCRHQGTDVRCELETWGALATRRATFEASRSRETIVSAAPSFTLADCFELSRAAPERGVFHVPPRGLTTVTGPEPFADPWRQRTDLVAVAQGVFRGEIRTFKARDVRADVFQWATTMLSVLAPLAALAATLSAERRTRWFRAAIDPAGGTARARSFGLGGPPVERSFRCGPSPRLQCTDDPGGSGLSFVCVVGHGADSPPILTAHASAHRATLDRLAARANRALVDGRDVDPSPSLLARLAPSVVLLAASTAALGLALSRMPFFPSVSGTLVVTNSGERCEVDGVELRRGGWIEWALPAGERVRRVMMRRDGRGVVMMTGTLQVELSPDECVTYDCALIASEARGLGE